MRALYFGIAGTLTAVAIGVVAWRKWPEIKAGFAVQSNRVTGSARSVWGRVEQAAKNALHTERDIQPSA